MTYESNGFDIILPLAVLTRTLEDIHHTSTKGRDKYTCEQRQYHRMHCPASAEHTVGIKKGQR